MTRKIFLLLLLCKMLTACNPSDKPYASESDIDAAREFVRAALDGDHRKASNYLLRDTTNDMLFQQQQTNYRLLSPEDKRQYKESVIRPVNGIERPNDSTTLFRYYHTANPQDTTLLRIVKKDGAWLVDLKSVIKM